MKKHSVSVSFGVREGMDLLTSRGKHLPSLSLESGLGGGGSSSLLPVQAGHEAAPAESSSLSELRRYFLWDPLFAVNGTLEGERTTKAGGDCCFGGVQSMVGVCAWRWGRCRYASGQPSTSRLFSPTQQLTPRAFAF